MKVVADKDIPHLSRYLDNRFDCIFKKGSEISFNDIIDAEVLIIRTRTKCNADLLKNSGIKLIATATIGTDHIDLDYCLRNGIKVINANGCNAASVQVYIASVISYLILEKKFIPQDKTLGIIGYGNVGSLVEKLGEAFGMKVLLNDPFKNDGSEKFYSLSDLVKYADIVTLHVPLTFEGQYPTFHIVNDRLISSLKETAILINASRGEVIDENSLKNFDRERIILDVWENEPHINGKLLNDVALGTAHIAGYSFDGKLNGTMSVAKALFNYAGIEQFPIIQIDTESKDIIEFDCTGKPYYTILSEIITKVYDVTKDSENLKCDISGFETLRSNYPIRRDFGYYKLKLYNATIDLQKRLSLLGFKSVTND